MGVILLGRLKKGLLSIREQTYPTLEKGKSFSKVSLGRDIFLHPSAHFFQNLSINGNVGNTGGLEGCCWREAIFGIGVGECCK